MVNLATIIQIGGNYFGRKSLTSKVFKCVPLMHNIKYAEQEIKQVKRIVLEEHGIQADIILGGDYMNMFGIEIIPKSDDDFHMLILTFPGL